MKNVIYTLGFGVCLLSAGSAFADQFSLTSPDIQDGKMMSKTHEFQGFGCTGDNQSPALEWHNAPEGTKSFAVLVHDRDAPTGSGWWHWQVINIPATTLSLPRDAGNINGAKLPKGAMQIESDYGTAAFGGACPPPGHGVHHYTFTVHALSGNLELPATASGALVGYMVNANTIEKASIEALYERK
ncbi:YbhB/YbcL family Raf kinase inhibitor-like protein [Pseudoalteromonas xiamenensis]|uniref:YbhB/YbcL family Raf kinase inhibitor-like protein n=1 Tax=Pseudoalteromonas xiamenensis TaxID=882626 RepID=A0A975DLQ2_9GAMM|nr:YbhB/YbcL family Raf kinase inhibitor-like protein [Pseudoalteromonas xiamenensis]QTH73537.1 YbhB/YbcL family Raf kinase inhibitor-like protein [Pseudoalteromonas xiamenensis]